MQSFAISISEIKVKRDQSENEVKSISMKTVSKSYLQFQF